MHKLSPIVAFVEAQRLLNPASLAVAAGRRPSSSQATSAKKGFHMLEYAAASGLGIAYQRLAEEYERGAVVPKNMSYAEELRNIAGVRGNIELRHHFAEGKAPPASSGMSDSSLMSAAYRRARDGGHSSSLDSAYDNPKQHHRHHPRPRRHHRHHRHRTIAATASSPPSRSAAARTITVQEKEGEGVGGVPALFCVSYGKQLRSASQQTSVSSASMTGGSMTTSSSQRSRLIIAPQLVTADSALRGPGVCAAGGKVLFEVATVQQFDAGFEDWQAGILSNGLSSARSPSAPTDWQRLATPEEFRPPSGGAQVRLPPATQMWEPGARGQRDGAWTIPRHENHNYATENYAMHDYSVPLRYQRVYGHRPDDLEQQEQQQAGGDDGQQQEVAFFNLGERIITAGKAPGTSPPPPAIERLPLSSLAQQRRNKHSLHGVRGDGSKEKIRISAAMPSVAVALLGGPEPRPVTPFTPTPRLSSRLAAPLPMALAASF